jgi:hypothetical protein
MKARRTLVLHAGGGKAGSSAIQSALNQAANCLADQGISYIGASAPSTPYEITSGNGIALYERISKPEFDAETLVEGFLGDRNVGICSSEYLGSMASGVWRRILAAAESRDIDLKVVYFVRSAVGYIAASYNQDVKRGGESRTLDQVAREATWQHFDDLTKLAELFDEQHLRVINYDIARGDIISAFVAAWPELEACDQCLRHVEQVTVNRSLSGAEIQVMRRVNSRLHGNYGPEISDRLIMDQPELRTRLLIPDETAKVLATKFAEPTKWINERFFAEAQAPLRVSAGVSIGDPEDSDQIDQALAIILDWALEKLADERADISFIRNRLLNIDWEHANDKILPPDFDPLAYLFLNEDLLRSETPPYEHYIANGHREGRPYRWNVRLEGPHDDTIAAAISRLHLDDSQDWAGTAVWPRMRHFIQLEGLLHAFAERERTYLGEIRRLREENGYEGEIFKRRVEEVVRPVVVALEASEAGATARLDNLSSRLNEVIERGEVKFNALSSCVDALAENVRSQTSAQQEEQTKLRELISAQDEELTAQRAVLAQYRERGLGQFLRWAFSRSARP